MLALILAGAAYAAMHRRTARYQAVAHDGDTQSLPRAKSGAKARTKGKKGKKQKKSSKPQARGSDDEAATDTDDGENGNDVEKGEGPRTAIIDDAQSGVSVQTASQASSERREKKKAERHEHVDIL